MATSLEQLDILLEALYIDEDVISKLSSWDIQFLESFEGKTNDINFSLTEKQEEQVERIYDKCYD